MMVPATESGLAAAWSIDACVNIFRHRGISIFNAGFASVKGISTEMRGVGENAGARSTG
jgi:hypothetical protein